MEVTRRLWKRTSLHESIEKLDEGMHPARLPEPRGIEDYVATNAATVGSPEALIADVIHGKPPSTFDRLAKWQSYRSRHRGYPHANANMTVKATPLPVENLVSVPTY